MSNLNYLILLFSCYSITLFLYVLSLSPIVTAIGITSINDDNSVDNNSSIREVVNNSLLESFSLNDFNNISSGNISQLLSVNSNETSSSSSDSNPLSVYYSRGSNSSTITGAVWFLVIVTVLPLLCVCCIAVSFLRNI